MKLEDIPTTRAVPEHPTLSAVVSKLRQVRPSRRTVLKGMFVAAAVGALAPIDWLLTRREAAAAGSKSEFLACAPLSYDEEANTWWTDAGPATCYGGWRRGSLPCADGWHREGAFSSRGEKYTSTRTTSTCEGRNGWRWKEYRCSDAFTQAVFADGSKYHGVTIAACVMSAADRAPDPDQASTPASAPAARPAPTATSRQAPAATSRQAPAATSRPATAAPTRPGASANRPTATPTATPTAPPTPDAPPTRRGILGL